MLGLLCVKINAQKQIKREEKENKEVIVNKVKEHYDEYVKVDKKAKIYIQKDKKYKSIGMVNKGVNLSLEPLKNKKQTHFKIKDSEYYISYQDVCKSEDVTFEENYKRYLPFNENVVSNKNVNLYDENGNLAYTLKNSIDLPIYAKKNDMNYVVFNRELMGIKKEDTQEVKVNSNTDKENATKVPVFMYHFFYDQQVGETAKDNNFTEIHKFREELDYAKNNGYQSVKMKDLDLYLDGSIRLPQKSFLITMDDNAESVKRLAYPVLEETQTYGTNFVISSWTQEFENLKSNYVELQSHSDAMHQGGCKGMGHGGRFMCIGYQDGVNDLTLSSQKLYGANVFCYPFGDYNEGAKKMLRDANYAMAFTVEHGYTKMGMDKLQLPRLRINDSTSVASFVSLLEG